MNNKNVEKQGMNQRFLKLPLRRADLADATRYAVFFCAD